MTYRDKLLRAVKLIDVAKRSLDDAEHEEAVHGHPTVESKNSLANAHRSLYEARRLFLETEVEGRSKHLPPPRG